MGTSKAVRKLADKENIIPSDLNSIVNTGIYEYGGTASNKPATNGGILFSLFNWDNQGVQIARPNHDSHLYTRYNVAGTWTSWRKVFDSDYIEFRSVATSATSGSSTGFHFSFTAQSSFTCFYFDNAGRVALIIKTSNSAATISTLHGSFNAVSNTTTDVYLNAGQWCRASFQLNSLYLDYITITPY